MRKRVPNQIRLSVIDSIVQILHLCTFTLSEHCKISEHAQKYRSVLGCNTKKDILKCRFNRLIANVQHVCIKQFSKYFYCQEIKKIYNTEDRKSCIYLIDRFHIFNLIFKKSCLISFFVYIIKKTGEATFFRSITYFLMHNNFFCFNSSSIYNAWPLGITLTIIGWIYHVVIQKHLAGNNTPRWGLKFG